MGKRSIASTLKIKNRRNWQFLRECKIFCVNLLD